MQGVAKKALYQPCAGEGGGGASPNLNVNVNLPKMPTSFDLQVKTQKKCIHFINISGYY